MDAVLEATDSLLSRRSEDLTLQGIAERAGVGIGSIYDYFANADGVLGSFVRRLTRENFDALNRMLEQTRGRRFVDALPTIIDSSLATYLDAPLRTKAVISIIFRLGLARIVVDERDRFAQQLARRILDEHPTLDPTLVTETAELMCDVLMGVVMAELWRDRAPAAHLRIRRALHALVANRVDQMLATRISVQETPSR